MRMHDQAASKADYTSEASQHALARRLQSGDDAAFVELVKEFGPRLLSVIHRYLPDDTDAQDALQNTFVSVFKAIDQFQCQSRLDTWLHRIAVNSALQVIRKRKRRQEVSIDDMLPQYLPDGHRANPGPAWQIDSLAGQMDEETRALIRHHIHQLPEIFRVVLVMRDIDQLSTEEVAVALEISESNVKTRLHRARQALRESLDHYFCGPAKRGQRRG